GPLRGIELPCQIGSPPDHVVSELFLHQCFFSHMRTPLLESVRADIMSRALCWGVCGQYRTSSDQSFTTLQFTANAGLLRSSSSCACLTPEMLKSFSRS